jgi:1-acyl-sn-glycerol-3-phosphate acyltransferase
MKSSSTALARITDVAAQDVLPFAQRLWAGARRSFDEMALGVLGRDFEARAQALATRYAELGGDPFGLDLGAARSALFACALLYRGYFRVEARGVEHVPEGRALLIANHSGQVPIDGAMIASALFLNGDPPRMIRAMVEKWAQTLPFVSTFFSRVGQVVGVPENARRLLELGELLLVFPEGARGISKPFRRRYQLEEFGTGFMRLAIEMDAPIVPVAVVGAEEQYVNLGNIGWAARALGMPAFPLIPQVLVPGMQLPLPVKYRIYFGEPLYFHGDADEDDAVIEEKVFLVKQTVQSMVNRGLKERRGLFL